MTRLAWLAAVACLILAACGRQSSPAPESAASTTLAATAATAQNAQPAALPSKTATAPALPAEVVNAGEELETVEADEAPVASPSPLLAAALAATPAAPTPGSWKLNENYLRLIPTQPTVGNLKSGKIEVVEVFWYGCGHCYVLDRRVEAWRKNKPAYVEFVRVPAMWNEGVKLHARLFYTLEALGKLDEMHSAIFDEIHQNRDPLIDRGADPVATGRIQATYARKFGVSEEDYLKAYNSFGVDQKLRRAEQLNRAYMVTAVPTFVVNGKYWTDAGHAGGEEQLFALLTDLATMEKSGR
jgi:thiol:disulfide interchange protein DsbA